MKSGRPQVLVSVPNGDGWLHKLVSFALLNLMRDARFETTVIMPTHKPYENNVHLIMRDFLKGPYDFWLSMDDDNPPRPGVNPLDLVLLDKDIVGCPTPVWANMKRGDYPMYWNAMRQVEGGFKPHEPCEGLQQVDAVGSGCIMVARRVVEALKDDDPFHRRWSKGDGPSVVEMGGDFSFCCKARERGFKVWAHYGYPCMHINEIELGEVIMAFNDLKTSP